MRSARMAKAALGLAAWASLSVLARAAEPKRTVLLDNDAVRVAEVVFEPGDSELPHTHDTPVVVFFVTNGTLENVTGDGRLEKTDGKVGDFLFLPKGTSHFTRNPSKERVVCRVVAAK